jgi:hypothetical protein
MSKVSIQFQGGIGNQLFQISALLAYAKKSGKDPVTCFSPTYMRPGEFLLDKFTILSEMIKVGTLNNPVLHYESPKEDIPRYGGRDVLLIGYFQSEHYFKHISDSLKILFNSLFDTTCKLPRTVGLHIRRGDYLKYPDIYHVYEQDYFRKCMRYFEDVEFIVVSDDKEYALANFQDLPIFSQDSFSDFSVLKNCQGGLVIPNSTFSWWAAFLNPGEIIYPKEWLKGRDNSNYAVTKWVNVDYFNKSEFDVFKQHPRLTERLPLQKHLVPHLVQILDSEEEIAGKIVKICTSKLVQVTHEVRLRIHTCLNSCIHVNMCNIPILVVSRQERRSELKKRFEVHNLTPVFTDAVLAENGTKGCGLAMKKALKLGLRMGTPFCVMEDDIQFSEHFRVEFDLPEICDALYLGTSPYGLVNREAVYKGVECRADIMGYVQVFNMLSTHAILFVNPKWTEKLYHIYKAAEHYRSPCDMGSASLQNSTNVLAPRFPWIYQDPNFYGQGCTLTPLDTLARVEI